ncbi:MAG: ThuA domain-containing protein [Myxococcales bacterium]|nr:ThuA domain-containing protein [Myxococcales bacterium]MBK7198122.1 ThuA domain-containing protein [Myxococcales bacterium]
MRPLVLLLALAAACGDDLVVRRDPVIDAACRGTADQPRVLVFSRETLWTHPSTPVARAALVDMCATRGFTVTASSDPAAFTSGVLADVDVVVFAVTSGNVLDEPARDAFEPWVRAGGGVVGLHSASATEYDWPFFVELIGARFRTHPPVLTVADVTVEDPAAPSATGLPARWSRTDEWYAFHERPEDQGVHVVLALDEASAQPPLPDDQRVGYHPIAWTDDHLGGRMFYTAMGHTPESYAEPAFLDLVAHALTWAAGN